MGVDVGYAASAASGSSGDATAGGGAAAEDPEEGEGACQVEAEPAVAGTASALEQGAAAAAGAGVAEEALDQAQLLGAGAAAAGRSMFRLSASLGTLQVLLNYEGAGCSTLSQVGVECYCPAALLPKLECMLRLAWLLWHRRSLRPAALPLPTSHPPQLHQASVDRFTFGLDIRPDTSMTISSTLGNVRVSQLAGRRIIGCPGSRECEPHPMSLHQQLRCLLSPSPPSSIRRST